MTSKEFDLALRLIADMSDTWKPDRYKDTYRGDLLQRIRERVRKGEARSLTEATREQPARRSAEVIDLTALLRRSLETKAAARPATRTVRHRSASRRTRRTGS